MCIRDRAIRAAENQKAVERYQTTYRPRVNVYTSSDRNPQPAKINVEINSSSNNPNIHIEDSYLYQDTAEIEAIITIIQESPQYDPSVFTRKIASYSAEWQAVSYTHLWGNRASCDRRQQTYGGDRGKGDATIAEIRYFYCAFLRC